jgi:hypothetical protein
MTFQSIFNPGCRDGKRARNSLMERRDDSLTAPTTGQEHARDCVTRGTRGRLWAYGLTAGLLAGLASILVGESVLDWFNPNIAPASIRAPADERGGRSARIHAAEINRVALATGILGAFEGLSLGLAGGLARRSARAAMTAAAGGLVVGACVAVGAPLCILPYYINNRNFFGESFLAPLLLHAALYVPIGAAGGLALGLGLASPRRITSLAAGGLIGAALGTLVNDFATVVLFPLSSPSLPLADTPSGRVASRLFVAVLIAVFVVAAVPTMASDDVADGHSHQ